MRPSPGIVFLLVAVTVVTGAVTVRGGGLSASRLAALRQLPESSPGKAAAFDPGSRSSARLAAVPGRKIPDTVSLGELASPGVVLRAVPLPEANTLAGVHYAQRRFGRVSSGQGAVLAYNPEVVLAKFRGHRFVDAIRVEAEKELSAAIRLASRDDVEFCELDVWQERAFVPDDPFLGNQWHHQGIGSFDAWERVLGGFLVRLAIVDTPFRMDHPDLIANVDDGWDAVATTPITGSSGVDHSTLGAGLAAAVINNGVGVAGACNARILPININGALSEMYQAVVWAAGHGVRVANISWTGGDSDTLEAAGAYLAERARGVLVMAGGNTGVPAYTTNQPDVYCISMTDAADLMRSLAGVQVDFAAPGYSVYSTSVEGYAYCSGTSYSAPLFAGVVAGLFSINPLLGPADVIEILKSTASDLGPPGWDMWYGWGRINYGAASREAYAQLPQLELVDYTPQRVLFSTTYKPGFAYGLWRRADPGSGAWVEVTNPVFSTNNGTLFLQDTSPIDTTGFYRLSVNAP